MFDSPGVLTFSVSQDAEAAAMFFLSESCEIHNLDVHTAVHER
jgi:hypothetical protein